MSTVTIEDRSGLTKPEASVELSSWWPEPEALVRLSSGAFAADDLVENPTILSALGAPGVDMVTTSWSARASVLAAATGRAFYAHELRGRLPMPEALEPEVGVWQHDRTTPVWDRGVLVEPKYFSFFQDAPLPAFNPNHRRKWRAHELLHGVMGFFWHPEMSRFDFYASARLNELVPVVHWYGLDEMFRARCPEHQGARLLRTHCVACEQAARPFWTFDRGDDAARANALRFATLATAHLTQEWEASMREIETGQRQVTHWHGLNASSDAVGYLKGHWPRCTAWSFGAWMEQFMVAGVDYEETLDAYAHRVATRLCDLVHGDVSVSLDAHKRLRQRRQLQDIAYRTYVALEWLDESHASTGAIEDACMDVLERMADVSQSLLQHRDVGEAVDQLTGELFGVMRPWRSRWPAGVVDGFEALGYQWSPQPSSWLSDHLKEGIESAFPMTSEQTGWSPSEDAIAQFLQSDEVYHLGTLRERCFSSMSDHVQPAPGMDAATLDWLTFERWIGELPQTDEEAEDFAVIPSDAEVLSRGRWRLNQTFRRRQFDAAFVQRGLGLELDDALAAQETVEILAVYLKGSLRLAVIDSQMHKILACAEGAALNNEVLSTEWEMVETLFFDGVLIWTGYLS